MLSNGLRTFQIGYGEEFELPQTIFCQASDEF